MPGYANPQNLNRYSYVNNNPLRYTDPTGHRPDDGCRTGEGCNVSAQTIIDDNKRANDFRNTTERNKCRAGNKNSCSYSENHPLETAGFVVTGLVAGPLVENFILGGGAAATADTALLKVALACAGNVICFRAAVALGILDYYPTNNGFASDPLPMTLQPGEIITRYGENSGKYASPIGTSISARAIPPGVDISVIRGFEVVKPIRNVLSGPVQGWFGQGDGATQYYLGVGGRTIQSLIETGHLNELP